ncbi:glycosyltransferase family 2 protein [Luteipulveratus mongoliensis]|uniref:Glucosyl transferase n=1 Tax=Luteipulveratus mongoliensis TaxID=571913 RepID=A0A0K1JQ82_9MICO|nr:glycosyltransferase family 2 protein [Luteipulveratus mongoliensis]AKU18881.1 glucosyl transferase [Luteipulveratus mongoliensis]
MTPELSVVVPMYDEQEVLPLFVERLRPTLDALGVSYEVVAVDDGSGDQTPVLLQRFLREWPQLRVIRLRANSGHQAAISAGLGNARGGWIATIDADLQDPPEVIGEMLEAGRAQGADVIYGVRSDRSTDSAFKRTTARGFYRMMRIIGGDDIRMDAGDFRLMSRATVDAVNALPEHHRVLRLVIPTLGFPEAEVGYKRDARAAGDSKYPLSKMLKLTIDSVTGFSLAPLRLATWFGLGGFAIAAALLTYAVISKLMGNAISGWTSTVVIVAGFAALQLLCLGILGEYVGRIYSTQQARPTYYVAYDSLLGPVNAKAVSPSERRPDAEVRQAGERVRPG